MSCTVLLLYGLFLWSCSQHLLNFLTKKTSGESRLVFLCVYHLLTQMVRVSCDRCCSGQRSGRRPSVGGHGSWVAFPTRHVWRLRQVRSVALLHCFLFWNILVYKWTLLLYSTASLRCSGSVMQTNGPTVHPRDSIPSLVLSTLLWWGLLFKVSVSSNVQNLFRNLKFLKSFSPSPFQARGSRAVFQLYPENSEQVKRKTFFFFSFSWWLSVFSSLVSFPELIFPLSKAGADYKSGHESRLQWRHGGGLPQQQQGQKVRSFYFPLKPS